MAGQITQTFQETLSNAISDIDQTLSETRELITRMKSAGFPVSDLESKQRQQEATLDRLRRLV